MVIKINHDPRYKKFYINIKGKQCWLKYRVVNEYLIELKLLFVPKSLRGLGFGKRVVEQVIAFAQKRFMKIIPTCSYIKEFFETNLYFRDMVYTPVSDFKIYLQNN